MNKKQQGVSLEGFIFWLFLLGIGFYAFSKVGLPYFDAWRVKSAATSAVQGMKEDSSESAAKEALLKNLYMNNIKDITDKDVKITSGAGGEIKITIKFRRNEKINDDISIAFEKELVVSNRNK